MNSGLQQRSLTRRTLLKLGAGAVALAGLGSLNACAPAAPAYPTKAITLIQPFGAGSAPDATFRILAEQAEKELGQKITVVNKPGPGGTVGASEVAQSKADGYTIGMAAVAILDVQPFLQDVPYKGPQDFTIIAQTNEAPMVIYVKADSPYKTLKDLIDDAKKNPGKVTLAASGGLYTIGHVETTLLEQLAGVKFNTVPYEAAQTVTAILGGTIQASTGQVALVNQHVKAGTIRVLCVFGPGRNKSLPDVPNITELGYDIKDIPYEYIIAPKDLPKEAMDKLVPAFKKAVESQAFKDYAEKTGILVSYLPPEEITKKLTTDWDRFKKLVDEVGWAKKK